jgi:DNA-binding CsgD family transcriptional regulator
LLHAISGRLCAEGGALFSTPNASALAPVWSEGVDSLAHWAFADPVGLSNPRAPRAMRLAQSGAVVTESDVCTDWELDHLPFNAGMLKLGFKWDAGTVVADNPLAPLLLTFHRRARQGRFEAPEKRAIKLIAPHIGRAVRIAGELGHAKITGLLDGFERSGRGAVVLDKGGLVLRMNETAEKLVGTAFRLRAKRMCALSSEDQPGLDYLVATICSVHPSNIGSAPTAALPRRSARPAVAIGMPLAGEARDVFSRAAALVLLVDPAGTSTRAAQILQQIHALTPAETRLALALANGATLWDIAQKNQASIQTVRTQLKSVMAKTDTHRQSELAALIAKYF